MSVDLDYEGFGSCQNQEKVHIPKMYMSLSDLMKIYVSRQGELSLIQIIVLLVLWFLNLKNLITNSGLPSYEVTKTTM